MYLLIEEWHKSYFRSSNVIMEFSVTTSMRRKTHTEMIMCGHQTITAEGLFYLFVNYHEVVGGTPRAYYVRITPREAKVFKMIAQTGFWRKRSYWSKVFKKHRSDIIEELEGMLPVWVLRQKLLPDKKC